MINVPLNIKDFIKLSPLSIAGDIEITDSKHLQSPWDLLSPKALTRDGSNGKDSALVVGGSTVSFDRNLSLQQKNDVADSLLFSQYAANAKYDRENQTEDWYKLYRSVLENLGWIISGFTFVANSQDDEQFEMHKKILDVFSKAIAVGVPGNPLPILEATINSMKNLDADSSHFKVFESQSSNGQNGNFQISTSMLENGVVTVSLGAFYFKAVDTRKKFLFFKWGKGTINFYSAFQQIRLNETVYSYVRNDVNEKLKSFTKSKIDIPLEK